MPGAIGIVLIANHEAVCRRDAQCRFQVVFRRLLSVFARPEHLLGLFLDDLQWLDAATLDLLAVCQDWAAKKSAAVKLYGLLRFLPRSRL